MDFMMKILYLISEIRCGFLDFVFENVTHLGEETLFLAISIFIFWCVDKRRGYYALFTGLVGTALNQALKLALKIPRPWVYDESFVPVGDSKIEATGYSFPSGHTQNVGSTFGCIARSSKSRPVRVFSISLILLVGFSRMYLGVHTLLDVLVSLVISAALVLLLYRFFDTEEHFEKSMPYIVIASFVISLSLLLYVFLTGREGVDEANLYSAMKNSTTLFGCMIGLAPVYFLDKRYIKFKTDGKWYAQIIKLALGLCGVMLIKSGLSSPLVALFGNEFVARAVRYFLIVCFAGIIWPMTFKYFGNLKIDFLDSFSEKISRIFKSKKAE